MNGDRTIIKKNYLLDVILAKSKCKKKSFIRENCIIINENIRIDKLDWSGIIQEDSKGSLDEFKPFHKQQIHTFINQRIQKIAIKEMNLVRDSNYGELLEYTLLIEIEFGYMFQVKGTIYLDDKLTDNSTNGEETFREIFERIYKILNMERLSPHSLNGSKEVISYLLLNDEVIVGLFEQWKDDYYKGKMYPVKLLNSLEERIRNSNEREEY